MDNHQRPLSWESITPWLTLAMTEGLGSLRIAKLIEHFGSPEHVLNASPKALGFCLPEKIVNALIRTPDNKKLQGYLARVHTWYQHCEHHFILCPDNSAYPLALKELPDYPPVLFLTGDIKLLNTPRLAIVGSRRPSLQGKTLAKKFAKELSLMGLTITSGMATGVDTSAHYGALDGSRASIAVIGTGIDRVYPATNQLLAKLLATHGLLISEFPLGTPPVPANFPRRNRIISGLSLGVLVVEAAEKSGSLITARLALEQGREVFAVPGSINNPQAKGCHRLIREGAVLIDEAQQIIEELRVPLECWVSTTTSALTTTAPVSNDKVSDKKPHTRYFPVNEKINCPIQRRILEAIGSDTWHIDELLLHLSIKQQALTTALTLLELNGFIKLGAGGYQRL